jgi:subtilisin family serine protease
MKYMRGIFVVAFCVMVQPASPASKIGGHLAHLMNADGDGDSYAVWVTFIDKGPTGLRKMPWPAALVSERSLMRRRNVLPEDALVDVADLPIEESYVAALHAAGARVRQRSRWFNAVSLVASHELIQRLSLLPFVQHIELVGKYGKRRGELPADAAPPPATRLRKDERTHTLDYGPSFNQLFQIKVPAVHDLGNHAEGVIVGVFDNGFRLLTHEVFATMNIVATRDFVEHKTSVVPSNPAPDFGDHGVNTLSTIGGYKPGRLIGPAFGASYILARTENDSSETPVEEDNWLAAMEWADSIGVQVTSTSLGYGNSYEYPYPPPYESWTWEDMNGRTTLVSRAAAMAVRKGIVVLNSAGNEGYNASHNTLNAPSDADSVLAVGAVTLGGGRASFSSVGPSTSDPPRIKPDVVALGTSVYIAGAYSPAEYDYGQGTSFACPLAAGVAALLVKAAPQATPMAIVNAMKATASNADFPNNFVGWGVLNARAALDYLMGGDTSVTPGLPASYALYQNYPNPFNPATKIRYRIEGPGTSWVRLAVYDLLGREIAVLVNGFQVPGNYELPFVASGLASGVYVYRLEALGTKNSFVESRKMVVVR